MQERAGLDGAGATPPAAPEGANDPGADAERLTRLLDRCERLADPEARALVTDTVSGLVALFGEAVARVIRHAQAAAGGGPPLVERVQGDPVLVDLLDLFVPQPKAGGRAPRLEDRPLRPAADPSLVQIGGRRSSEGRPAASHGAGLRCEWCAEPLPEEHDHVADLDARNLRCACRACALLFDRPGAGGGRYRRVQRRAREVRTTISVREWTALGIPVALAFVFRDSTRERWLAVYPSPGGPVESELDAAAWERLLAGTPALSDLQPDVEAVAVHGERGAADLHARVAPITECYALIGEVRARWTGFEGGDGVRRAVASFFDAGPTPQARGDQP